VSVLVAEAHGEGEIRVGEALLTLIEQVDLPAKEQGSLADLSVREGDVVKQGAPLGAIEDDQACMAVSKAEREVEVARTKADNDVSIRYARKAYEVAAAEHRRALESVEKFHKSVSATELDQLRLNAEKSLLEIEQAEQEQAIARLVLRQKESELDLARLKLERHRLTAPFTGMVVEVKKHRGEWLNPGDTVVRLVRLDRLRVEAFVPAREFASRRQEQGVTLIADVPGKKQATYSGAVVFVSPEVNPVSGQVRLWAEVNNDGLALRPGQTGVLVVHPSSSAAHDQARRAID
jgi:macrolide-specific efflux system membrane fusion protein